MNEDLAKMGAARVRLASLHGVDCIIKQPVSAVEFQFYHQVAPEFRAAGIAVPELLSRDAATQTLCLEYIPQSISQHELAERDDILAMIARIHRYPVNQSWSLKHHRWCEDKTLNALELLKLPESAAAIVLDIAKLSACLFNPTMLISGDTNAGNWGIRQKGDAVLFDWERFGTGSPAIDLAPLIKGMGNISDFIHFAERYQDVSPLVISSTLAQEIAICKLWIVTEVIDILHTNHKAELDHYLNWYRSHLPAWLKEVQRFIG